MDISQRQFTKYFASGPCAKYPGWQPIASDIISRSHTSKHAQDLILYFKSLIRTILDVPSNYEIILASGSATGAMEMAIWSLLGSNGVDIVNYGPFGNHWQYDIVQQLKLKNIRVFAHQYSPDGLCNSLDNTRDLVIVGTEVNGFSVKNLDFVNSQESHGLVLYDAAASVFMEQVDWQKIDAYTFSLQKALGGEPGIGVVVLSPKAIQRLRDTSQTTHAIPRVYRLFDMNQRLRKELFAGKVTNTISLMALQDCIYAIEWAKNIGGLQTLIKITTQNYHITDQVLKSQTTFDHIAPEYCRAICPVSIHPTDELYHTMDYRAKWQLLSRLADNMMETEIAYDLIGHPDGLPSLRIWTGPTIDSSRIPVLLGCLVQQYIDITHTRI